MKWEIGDSLWVVNTAEIVSGNNLHYDKIYDVCDIDIDGTPVIDVEGYGLFVFELDEMQYVKRVTYEMSDAELGEPSADCNCECDCGNLAEELADIKAMIGRLIRNGGDDE